MQGERERSLGDSLFNFQDVGKTFMGVPQAKIVVVLNSVTAFCVIFHVQCVDSR